MASGWTLEPACRARLLALFPPRYGQVLATCVTRSRDTGPGNRPPPDIFHARVVGHADDGDGLEALVVAIEGSTDRPDGGTWAIPWSRDPRRDEGECDAMLAAQPWRPRDGGLVRMTRAIW